MLVGVWHFFYDTVTGSLRPRIVVPATSGHKMGVSARYGRKIAVIAVSMHKLAVSATSGHKVGILSAAGVIRIPATW